MKKYDMRVYLADLEARIDRALIKWKKFSRIEDQELAQYEWQFEMSRVILDVFWNDKQEKIRLDCHCRKLNWHNEWEGLTEENSVNVMDRVRNFAQIVYGKKTR